MLDVASIRQDFPLLSSKIEGNDLCYLDNAATTQMPNRVLQEVLRHYHTENANVHRGVHHLSTRSTEQFELARKKVADFINVPEVDCVVFTKGTTNGINMVARGLERHIMPGDRIVVSLLEHHSNFVPWRMLCERTGASLEVVGLTDAGDIDLDALATCLATPAKIVAMTCCSNVLGTVTPMQEIVKKAHEAGALCLLDGAQFMRHSVIDIKEIGCDYFCFSGHKMLGPTGIGVLCGARPALDLLEPLEFGGEMVDRVSLDDITFEGLPLKLEAGTPNYVGAIALGHAIDYLLKQGIDAIASYEDELLAYAEHRLSAIPGLALLGSPKRRAGCLSFTLENAHPFDLCVMLDKHGIALRSGTNCAQPLIHDGMGLENVARLSVAFYNMFQEIDRTCETIAAVIPLIRQ